MKFNEEDIGRVFRPVYKDMEVKNVEIVEIRNSTVDNSVKKIVLQIKNGFNTFKFRITKKDLKYEELERLDKNLQGFTIKAVFYARNCCKNSPVIVLSSENEGDTEEIVNIVHKCLELKGKEIEFGLSLL